MNLIKKTALVTLLTAIAASASAMTPMQDENLAAVSGQDGVSIAANLNVTIGEFRYTNKTESASVSINNIKTTGLIAAAIDVINQTTFANEFITPNSVSAPTSFYGGGDVVKISLPSSISIDSSKLLSMSVDSIKMGNSASGTSFGSFSMNNVDMRGTTAYIWAH